MATEKDIQELAKLIMVHRIGGKRPSGRDVGRGSKMPGHAEERSQRG